MLQFNFCRLLLVLNTTVSLYVYIMLNLYLTHSKHVYRGERGKLSQRVR